MAGFTCATCGQEHEELPRDFAFGLPDEVFALPEDERTKRAVVTSETCVLDGEKHFLRCILPIPLIGDLPDHGSSEARLGLWVLVPLSDFNAIRDFAGKENDEERPIGKGVLGNAPRSGDASPIEVVVRPVSESRRPTVHATSDRELFVWQRDGLSFDGWMRLISRHSREWAAKEYERRSARYHFELEESEPRTCDCCGEKLRRLVRFVSFDDAPFVIYYAQIAEGHPGSSMMLVSLGPWEDDADPKRRVAFLLELRDSGARVCDAEDSPWGVPDIFGVGLSRDEALEHVWLEDAFEVSDVARDRDPDLAAHLRKEVAS